MVKIVNLLENKNLRRIIEIFLILFGLYILFELIRKIMGGSLATEDIIPALLIFILGSIFTVGIMLAQLKADHNHLKNQFKSLANDFKSHIKKK